MEVKEKQCLNCKNIFLPSKNDERIKFCSNECRVEFRRKNDYMKKYYKENNIKWVERQQTQEFKDGKNSRQKIKYRNDEEYRKNVIKRSKQYRIDHPMAKRNQDLMEKYNMTIEDYNSLLESQNGKCAICGKDNCGRSDHKYLYVDHNHQTGKVRGLLCASCNAGLGQFKDNISYLKNAVKYLEDNT